MQADTFSPNYLFHCWKLKKSVLLSYVWSRWWSSEWCTADRGWLSSRDVCHPQLCGYSCFWRCVCIIIDGCAAVIVVIIFIHWRHAAFFTKSNIFCRQNYVGIYKISLILYSLKSLRYITQRGGDSSVVRAPDSWLKGRGFESLLERRESFLLQGRLSVLTLISVPVPPPCYHSST